MVADGKIPAPKWLWMIRLIINSTNHDKQYFQTTGKSWKGWFWKIWFSLQSNLILEYFVTLDNATYKWWCENGGVVISRSTFFNICPWLLLYVMQQWILNSGHFEWASVIDTKFKSYFWNAGWLWTISKCLDLETGIQPLFGAIW